MRRALFIIFAVCAMAQAFSQNPVKVDSLKYLLQVTTIDTVRTKTLNSLAREYWTSNLDTALVILDASARVGEGIKDKKFLCGTLIYRAYTLGLLGNYDSSIAVYSQVIDLAKKHDIQKVLAQAYFGIGNIYNTISNYDDAIKYYMEAVKIQEKLGEKQGLARTYNSLGVLFEWQNDYKKALEYHKKGLELKRQFNDSAALAMSLSNIGVAYLTAKELDSSLRYHYEALRIRERIGDQKGILMSDINIGNVFSKQGKNKEAIKLFRAGVELAYKLNDKHEQANTLISLGNELFILHKYDEGISYTLKAKDIAEDLGIKELRGNIYQTLVDFYKQKQDYKKALEYADSCASMNAQMFDENKTQEIEELNTKYQTEKKQQQIESLNHKNEIQKLDIRQHKTMIYSAVIGLILLIGLAFVLYNRNVIKQRANKELHQKNELIAHQKEEVEEKNKEILDSINYAKRIQTALLPSEELFSEILPNSFVLFKPKGIVSGDFFWITQREDYVFFTAADCTGHGVPGAFMSMLGMSFLNEIINEKKVLEPCDILDLLKIKIVKSLKQRGDIGSNKDGMDMVLCRLNKSNNELVFAAANNPLWLLRNGEVIEYKADKQPVGIGSETFTQFTQHLVKLLKDDQVYIFSDGYADQFGGPKGKKFKYKQLEEVFISGAGQSPQKQKELLNTHFENWKGSLEQVDDVTIIGLRI